MFSDPLALPDSDDPTLKSCDQSQGSFKQVVHFNKHSLNDLYIAQIPHARSNYHQKQNILITNHPLTPLR